MESNITLLGLMSTHYTDVFMEVRSLFPIIGTNYITILYYDYYEGTRCKINNGEIFSYKSLL